MKTTVKTVDSVVKNDKNEKANSGKSYHKIMNNLDKKPFSCEFCESAFMHPSLLKRHERIHT